MLPIGLAGFVALPERFFPFPSVSLSPELSWLLWPVRLFGQSLKVVLSDSMT